MTADAITLQKRLKSKKNRNLCVLPIFLMGKQIIQDKNIVIDSEIKSAWNMRTEVVLRCRTELAWRADECSFTWCFTVSWANTLKKKPSRIHLENQRIDNLMLLCITVIDFWTTYKINNQTNRCSFKVYNTYF